MKTKLLFILASFFLPLAALHAQSNYATPYAFTTLAGVASGAGAVDGTGTSARFNHPSSLAVDGSGNIYVADTNNNTVRKVTSAGSVTTYAGSFSAPNGAAIDGDGYVYVADTSSHTIRKIAPGGAVTIFAGIPGSPGSTDGISTVAQFRYPFAVAAQVDVSGHLVYLFVADTYNSTIRKITPGGVVTTLAGTPLVFAFMDGTGSAASFSSPAGLTVDRAGNVYVADSNNNKIRMITPGGVVTTFATGFNDPLSVVAQLDVAGNLANLFVADTNNHTIRQVTAGGVVTTLAGSTGSPGSADGTGGTARFYSPAGVAMDSAGNVYVSDTTNDTIRKVTSGGVVTTLAGGAVYQSADGMGSVARFTYPFGVATDGAGNVYVADAGNNTIRRVSSAGVVTTLAGMAGVAPGLIDATGTAARFNNPVAVAVDGSGIVYVADAANGKVRKITALGEVTTLAGGFNFPTGVAVAVDGSGDVYVADSGNNAVRKVNSAGVVTTLAGMPSPWGVAVALDGSGDLYVTDVVHNTVRKITSGGVVTTFAGTVDTVGSTDATGSAARFNSPRGVAVDATGNVYVADYNNFTIRKISPAGVVTTLGGTPGALGSADGTGSTARFDHPTGIAVDGTGKVYVADSFNNTIRRGMIPLVFHDFDGDRKSDVLLTNTTTGERAVWLMNGTTIASGAFLGTLPVAWTISGTGDFNGDGKADVILTNTTTGERAIWLMNGTTIASGAFLGTLPVAWTISGTGDFNGDGKADVILTNTTTGERAIWLMNGTTIASGAFLGTLPVAWTISGTGDFNGDGKADVILTNTTTGERAIWLMNGTTIASGAFLGTLPVAWTISGTGDFDGDGKADVILTNTTTGERAIWLMNGTTIASGAFLGTLPVAWTISGTGDFDGDGKADVVLTNTTTGERAIWLMNGTTIASGAFLGTLPVEWVISP